MDQPISNTGPQEDLVAQAMARRGLGQQAPMMDQGAPAPMPMGAMPPPSMGMPQQPAGKQEFVPKDGHEFLLTTLAESLKNDYKLQSEKLKFGSPMMPQV